MLKVLGELHCDHTLGWRKEQSEAELWQEMGPWDGGQTVHLWASCLYDK